MNGDRASSTNGFAIDAGSGSYNTGIGIDLEESARVTGQRIGDRVGSGIQIEGVGRDTTVVPMATFSLTALAVASASVTAEMLNSFRSLMVMLKVCVAVEPSLDKA